MLCHSDYSSSFVFGSTSMVSKIFKEKHYTIDLLPTCAETKHDQVQEQAKISCHIAPNLL